MKGTNRICTPHDIDTSKQTDKWSNAERNCPVKRSIKNGDNPLNF